MDEDGSHRVRGDVNETAFPAFRHVNGMVLGSHHASLFSGKEGQDCQWDGVRAGVVAGR